MRVISLFDGISCGRLALDRAKIKIDGYFASEINKHALFVATKNYPDSVQLGDIRNIIEIQGDVVIGGPPCQDLSVANPSGKGLDGDRSGLFWEYMRILNQSKAQYFLLENVKMKKSQSDIITSELGVEPVLINSNLFSAQNRQRLYWTNIPIPALPLVESPLLIRDCIHDDSYKNFYVSRPLTFTKNYVKWDTSGKGYNSQNDRAYYKDRKICTMPSNHRAQSKLNIVVDLDNGLFRRTHPIEAERYQNVPDNYTEGLSDVKRVEVLGNGWTVGVIAHILQGLN